MFHHKITRVIDLKLSGVPFSTKSKVMMQAQIQAKLEKSFKPTHLEIINESSRHNVPKGSETHFKIVIVSESFRDSTLLQRHRKINELLIKEFESGLHALSIVAKTPEQWNSYGHDVHKSPPCLGGSSK
uniref:Uncharacterized protein n=1 Tax=Romanomermis culicivorax TaxID=13658 RepID=A0A915KZX3_ROMCU